MFKTIKDKFEIWCDNHDDLLVKAFSLLFGLLKTVFELAGSIVLLVPMILFYALVMMCGYTALGVNFPNLPELSYWTWVGIAIFAATAEVILVTPNYPRSEAEMEYLKATAKTWMWNRIKACIVVMFISLIYYGLGN